MGYAVIFEAVVIECARFEMAHGLRYLLAGLGSGRPFVCDLACCHKSLACIRGASQPVPDCSHLRVLITVAAYAPRVEQAQCRGCLDALVALCGGKCIASATAYSECSDAVGVDTLIARDEIDHSAHIVDAVLGDVEIAGQAAARTLDLNALAGLPDDALFSRLLTLDRDLLMIPSVAIHMDRDVNDRASYNKQVDMLPLLGGAAEEGVLKKLIAAELQVAEEQILGSDLFLCIREKAAVWGCNEEFISSGRLDDQQCVYGILKGLLTAKNARSIGVAAFFDNEEVGSGTKQGAASTFLYDVLHRIAQSLGGNDEDFHRAVASSFMVSADNAHAVHPNHPEHTDVNNCTYMNKGVVIKTHAGQKYTSDGMSVAAARELAARAGVPLQYFANRSDKVGGSTLGNLAMAQVSMNCVDIGLPQLAMHSCYETAGAEDTLSLIKLMQELYSSHFEETAFGTLSISK